MGDLHDNLQKTQNQMQEVQMENPPEEVNVQQNLNQNLNQDIEIQNQNKQDQRQERHSVDIGHLQLDAIKEEALRLSVRQNMLPMYEPDAHEKKEKQSTRFYNMTDLATRSIGGQKAYKLHSIPDEDTLGKEYKASFKDRLGEEERVKKQKNKKSRLYRKAQNATLLTDTIQKFEIASFDALNGVITRQALRVDEKDYHDLSMFMTEGDEKKNRELVNLYLGKSVKQEANAFEGQNISLALDTMASQLFSFDVGSLDLSNDTELVNHAAHLEKLSGQVAAFDRLSDKYHYMETLNEQDQKRLNERLDALRSIAVYYQVRKDIITNEHYKTHYNDELSMDITAAETPAQRKLAQQLAQSLVLGRTMMRLNGVPLEKKTFGTNLRFSSDAMNAHFADIQENYESIDMHRVLSDEAYAKKEVRAKQELVRLTSRIRELNTVAPVKEQEEIQEDMRAVQDRAYVPVQRPENRIGGYAKFKNYLKLGWRWFFDVTFGLLGGVISGAINAPEAWIFEEKRRKKAQDKRRHDMVPGREGEFFRDEIVRKDENGEDIDVYSDVRRGPMVWEKLTAGDPEDPPEVMIMVEQAKRGSNVSMSGGNMGHAMMCLSYSRYNKTTKRKERYQVQFGFYPGVGFGKTEYAMLEGAIAGGRLINDDGHAYDVARRYQVKPGDINKLLRKAETYADKGYGYYKRNCTTFVVDMAKEIGLTIGNEFKQEQMVFEGMDSLKVEAGRSLGGNGMFYTGANAISSRMNKMDMSYQNFGQKIYTKEDLDRFYATAETAELLPVGYTPGHAGETLRFAGSGELSANYEEDRISDFMELKNAVDSAGEKLWKKVAELIPENEMTLEDNVVRADLEMTGDGGLSNLADKEGSMTSEEVRRLHKEIRNLMKRINRYYVVRLHSDPKVNALVLKFLSLCETILSFADLMYRDSLRKEVKGDAGILRYHFIHTEYEVGYQDNDNNTYQAMLRPGEYEGYLMIGKTPDEIIKEKSRYDELKAIDEEERTSEQTDEFSRLQRTRNLAMDFGSANRYLLEKEEFDEKDIRYAFLELPQKEKDTKGNGKISKEFLKRNAPSIAYQGVILEKLFGGIRELKLDGVDDYKQRIQMIDVYLAEHFTNNTKLAGMILGCWMDGRGDTIEDLTNDFLEKIADCCIIPAYAHTKNMEPSTVSMITYGLITGNSRIRPLIKAEIEKIKNAA